MRIRLISCTVTHSVCFRCEVTALNNSSKKVPGASKGLADEIKAQIEKGISEDVPIWETAYNVGVSRWHMTRVFKNSTGMTPIEYKNSIRIGMAKMLLENTDMSISEVGIACGFSSTTYFSYRFKRTVGISPLMYRREAGKHKKASRK